MRRQLGHIGQGPVTWVLSSSGQMASAFAVVTAGIPGFTLWVVTDRLSSPYLVDKLETFDHVHVDVVDQPDETGSHMQARYQRIEEICREHPKAKVIDQYGDWCIPLAYGDSLVENVVDAAQGDIGAVFCSAGTVGHGYAFIAHSASQQSPYPVFLADSPGSRLFQSAPRERRRFPAYGNGTTTAFSRACGGVNPVYVEDEEVVSACDFLRHCAGLFVGPSSGAVTAAFLKLAWSDPPVLPHVGSSILIFPDGGEWYSDSLWSETWRAERGLEGLRAI